MAIGPRLDMRQTQSLVMTPQLQQAIKLLQLSNLELAAFIDQELERNPLLERDDKGDDTMTEAQALPQALMDDRPSDSSSGLDDSSQGSAQDSLDVDYDNLYNNDSVSDGAGGGEAFADWSKGGGRSDFNDSEGNLEQTLAETVSLRDHLVAQINMDLADIKDRLIGMHLISMLDEAGYLSGSIEDLAFRLGCPLERVEVVLGKMQRFDPAGIFARSLAECLAIQLREKNRFDPAMEALIGNLPLLAKRDMVGLMRICGVDAEDLTDMIAEIKALDPKPALRFDHAAIQAITPDVLMRRGPDGVWLVELNSDTLPRVLVDLRYFAQVSGAARNKEEKSYLAENFQSANWLVKSLHQRATTIMKVSTELIRQQDAFFRHGIQHLRPLVLRDIATAIGMHESTVSRVTSNKYISTPRGIFELKYFFTQSIGSADGGDAHSAESVRHRIKSLIDNEGMNVLSDDKIVEILKTESVDIARRTVAKYREGMNIPSSVQRRRDKSLRPIS